MTVLVDAITLCLFTDLTRYTVFTMTKTVTNMTYECLFISNLTGTIMIMIMHFGARIWIWLRLQQIFKKRIWLWLWIWARSSITIKYSNIFIFDPNPGYYEHVNNNTWFTIYLMLQGITVLYLLSYNHSWPSQGSRRERPAQVIVG